MSIIEQKTVDRTTQLKYIFKLINAFPIKTLLLVAAFFGGIPIVGYFVHIGYQPNLDLINFAFLAAQGLIAGSLILLGFSILFMTVLFAPPSLGAKLGHKENSTGRGQVSAFLLIVLSHLPIMLLLFVFSFDSDSTQCMWGIVLAFCLILFVVLLFYRLDLFRKAFQAESESTIKNTLEHTGPLKENEPITGKEGAVDDAVKKSSPSNLIMSEFFAYLGVMLFSTPALIMLGAILMASPVLEKDAAIMLLLLMALIGAVTGFMAIDKQFSIYIKLAAGLVTVVFILLDVGGFHIPFNATARIAGFGQIEKVDLTLSEKRCGIVKRQLSAAGMADRLSCIAEEPTAVKAPLEKEFMQHPGVLKNVTVLSRVGAEYLIEIAKGPHVNPKITKNTSGDTSTAELASPPSGKKPEKKNLPVEKEDVVRLIIPKADADELVSSIETLSLMRADKYRPDNP